MNSILVLGPNVFNQIAAGEVVERPASVVKELVENSIDAGASSISVDIIRGGIEYIRVNDNGHGISDVETDKAFLPHATSKIATAEDIQHIHTLGFRGEALPSIASVSEVIMKTRTIENETGVQLQISYGEKKNKQPCACIEGTTMEVRNLFAKTPARLKFLKNERTEAGYVGDYLSRMILSYPEISFSYSSNGKKIFQSLGDGDLKNAIFCIYGSSVLPYLKQVEFDDGYIKIEGYIGTKEISRSNRTQQTFIINRRYIHSGLISKAVQQAYETRIMTGQFPFAVLNIKLASSEVDINVHPTKMEVRFANESRIYNSVYEACDKALSASLFSNKLNELDNLKTSSGIDIVLSKHADGDNMEKNRMDADYSVRKFPLENLQKANHESKIDYYHVKKKISPEITLIPNEIVLSDYRIAGHFFKGYWIIEQDNEILIIDQHAAHERMLYEKIVRDDSLISIQKLLVPVYFRLNEEEFSALNENLSDLNSLGFDISPTENEGNDHGVTVKAVPVIDSYQMQPQSVLDIISDLLNNRMLKTKDFIRESIIQNSCKHAIKVNESISQNEIEYLLKEFKSGTIPLSCPHGRPVMVKLTKLEIEKMFKRVL